MQCLKDIKDCPLIWQAALAHLTAAGLAPNELMLIEGLNKLMSKLAPDFKALLKQADYMDKVNGKVAWLHTDLLKRLDRCPCRTLALPTALPYLLLQTLQTLIRLV